MNYKLFCAIAIPENNVFKSKIIPIITKDTSSGFCLKNTFEFFEDKAIQSLIDKGYIRRLEEPERVRIWRNKKEVTVTIDVEFTEKIKDFINWQ